MSTQNTYTEDIREILSHFYFTRSFKKQHLPSLRIRKHDMSTY